MRKKLAGVYGKSFKKIMPPLKFTFTVSLKTTLIIKLLSAGLAGCAFHYYTFITYYYVCKAARKHNFVKFYKFKKSRLLMISKHSYL